MIKFLVYRPVGTLVAFFGLFIFGIVCFLYSSKGLLPEIPLPIIKISVKADNYGAREVENKVLKILRTGLGQTHNLENIESVAYDKYGVINLKFAYNTNNSLAFIEVNEKIDLLINQLPSDLERPIVSKNDINQLAIFNFNITPKSQKITPEEFSVISNFAKDIIGSRIEQIPEVGLVDISGVADMQIQIQPNVVLLKTLGIPITELFNALQEININIGSVTIKNGHYEYFIQFHSNAESLQELSDMPINVHDRLFTIKDLASLKMVGNKNTGLFFSNARQGINLQISKQGNASMSDFKTHFEELKLHLQQEYPDLKFDISQDQSILLSYSLSNLVQDLIIGGIIACALMLVFVRKLKSAFLIAVTIPLTLFISQIGFLFFHISINIISLGGLILGLAMIIDNSIVVIDSINSAVKENSNLTNQVIKGVEEVIKPLVTSFLTNCAVFIPLIYMSGIGGTLFYDQALSITIGVFSSLIVALLFLPALYLISHRIEKDFEFKEYIDVTIWLERINVYFFRKPTVLFLLIILFIFVGLFSFGKVKKQLLPSLTRDDLYVTINWNEILTVDQIKSRISALDLNNSSTYVRTSWIGKQSYMIQFDGELKPSESRLYLKTAPTREFSNLKNTISRTFRLKFPKAKIVFSTPKNAFDIVFLNEQPSFVLQVTEPKSNTIPEPEKIDRLIKQVRKTFPMVDLPNAATSLRVVLTPDLYKAATYNVNISNLNNAVVNALQSKFMFNLQDSHSLIPVFIVQQHYRSVQEVLSENFVLNDDGSPIALKYLIQVADRSDYNTINGGLNGQYFFLGIDSPTPETDLNVVKQIIKNNEGDFSFHIRGSYFSNIETMKEMAIILCVSIILLYFILAAQFESLVQPLFILIEIPIAICGSIILLFLTNTSLNLMSLIGIVVMCGLIINDSILKIDAINRARKSNKSLIYAIFDGGKQRLKPILMISLTSIGSLLPTLFMHDLGSELQKPLAITLIGGMFIGLFVSLFFVPILYWITYRPKSTKI